MERAGPLEAHVREKVGRSGSGWQDEIKRMLASGLEYELDALANKDFHYLTKTYLSRKLKEKDWLD